MKRDELEKRVQQLRDPWSLRSLLDFAIAIHDAALEQAAQIADNQTALCCSTPEIVCNKIRAAKVNHAESHPK